MLSSKSSCLIESFHRRQKVGLLDIVWEQLQLQSNLHKLNVSEIAPTAKQNDGLSASLYVDVFVQEVLESTDVAYVMVISSGEVRVPREVVRAGEWVVGECDFRIDLERWFVEHRNLKPRISPIVAALVHRSGHSTRKRRPRPKEEDDDAEDHGPED